MAVVTLEGIPQVELSELRYFYLVARARSFAEGARLAGVSPPAISKSIKKLEGTLGMELLRRNTRRVRPTQAGELLLEHCQRIFGALGAMGRDLDARRGIVRGELRIGTTEVFSTFALPRTLTRVHAEHPELVTRSYLMAPSRAQRHLLDGRLDVALCTGTPPTQGLQRHVLARCPGRLVCGPHHPLAEAGVADEAALGRHPFVVPRFFDREHPSDPSGHPGLGRGRTIGATVEMLHMAIQMVAEGPFLGYFPQVAIRCQLNHGELCPLEGPQDLPGFELIALTRADEDDKPGIGAFLEQLELAVREAIQKTCDA